MNLVTRAATEARKTAGRLRREHGGEHMAELLEALAGRITSRQIAVMVLLILPLLEESVH